MLSKTRTLLSWSFHSSMGRHKNKYNSLYKRQFQTVINVIIQANVIKRVGLVGSYFRVGVSEDLSEKITFEQRPE